MNLTKRLVAEGLGTAFLLAIVVGSGIMGDRLSGGNTALTLLANSLATGAGLIVLITVFAPLSGAHFNPVVSFTEAGFGRLTWREACAYSATQIIGAILGVMATHFMFEEPLLFFSHHARTGFSQWWSECIATFGLVWIILNCVRYQSNKVAIIVGAYIMSAYWFTASTSFANPAVTIARAFTDTFAGIRPQDVFGFIIAQIIGSALACGLFCWFHPTLDSKTT